MFFGNNGMIQNSGRFFFFSTKKSWTNTWIGWKDWELKVLRGV